MLPRRKLSPRILFVCCLLALFSASPCLAQSLREGAVSTLVELSHHDRFDAIIAKTTELKQIGYADPKLAYFRGYAEWNLGRLEAARTDLEPLKDFQPWPKWPVASELLQKVQTCQSLFPHTEIIKHEGQVRCRVYYDEETDWVRAVIKLLPQAQDISDSLYKTKLDEASVFCTVDQDHSRAFVALHEGMKLSSWAWAMHYRGIALFSQWQGNGKSAPDVQSRYLRTAIPHEYSHLTMFRIVGHPVVPAWLDEGMAMVAGSQAVPEDIKSDDVAMQAQFAKGQILLLETLADRQAFNAAEEERQGNYEGASPYTQGFHMTRFLLASIKQHQFLQFLNKYAETGDLEKAFSEVFGFTEQEFFQAWQKTFSPG